MVIGQLGAAFAAKAAAPRVSLGTLFFAALVLDLVGPLDGQPILVLVVPLAVGLGYRLVTRQAEAALVVTACVLADAFLGLLGSVVELAVFGVGAALYLWRTQGTDRFGTLGGPFLVAVVIAARQVGWTLGPGGVAGLIALATWLDHHRERRPARQPAARVPCLPEVPPEADPDLPAEAVAVPSPSQPR
jgi:hypothetical protein